MHKINYQRYVQYYFNFKILSPENGPKGYIGMPLMTVTFSKCSLSAQQVGHSYGIVHPREFLSERPEGFTFACQTTRDCKPVGSGLAKMVA
jgi:hypothetical protein